MAADHSHTGDQATDQQGQMRCVIAAVNLCNPGRKNAVFGPCEHQAGNRKQHGRQVIDQCNRSTRQNRDRKSGGEQIAQHTGG